MKKDIIILLLKIVSYVVSLLIGYLGGCVTA